MADNNCYDVTQWPEGNPYKDVGQVINSIIGDIKSRQGNPDLDQGGKPGAVTYNPGGDRYQLSEDCRLRTWIHIFKHTFQYPGTRVGGLA